MLSATEVRALGPEDRKSRLAELRRELMQERGVQAMGGSTPSPGKIRTLRREIARILTIEREAQLGIRMPESKK
jgi:large subunit ribosomal protein L29